MNQRPFLGPCLSLPALLVMLLGASASAAEILSPGRLRERICDSPWEFSRLGDGAELARAKAYLGRAKAAGFTAVVFANTKWLALPSRAGAEYSARLKALGDEAARLGIGLVPMVTNFGDGAALLFHEPALAEGLPVRDALFVVRGRQAELQPDPPLELRNPGFEATDNGRPAGWTDEPGVTP